MLIIVFFRFNVFLSFNLFFLLREVDLGCFLSEFINLDWLESSKFMS